MDDSLKDLIKNKYTKEVRSRINRDKMRENRLRSFDHANQTPIMQELK